MKNKMKATLGILVLFLATSGVAATGSSNQSFFEDDFFDDDHKLFEDDFLEEDSLFDDNWFEDDRDTIGDQNDTQDSEPDVGVCVIGVDSPCNSEEYDGDNETINETDGNETDFPPVDDNETDIAPPEENDTDAGENETGDNETDDSNVTEEAYIEPAPEPGDYYYEAGTDDWVSYVNPRDEYNPAYDSREEAMGSGKVCMILLNEAGEPIVGETLPNTQATMELEGIDWHSESSFTVEFPMTENYERPLDSDQIGTSEDLPQGDGYMDAHCLEYHLVPEDHTLGYSELDITGEHAEDVEVVGYYDQVGTWDTDFDPVDNVAPYGADSSSDGVVSMNPDNSHAEVLAVMQLNRS